ncbi:3-phosphoserine/phosphohydroxythreonine transaminase [Companilactobacillus tucceti]|nr:3-phosphoserine/phosphohydroxythreonine transaminase [Companilactobacillus tucceti]
MSVYNFAAGPAMLPASVINQIKSDLPSFNDSGMSVMEISHRSDLFEKIINEAKTNLLELLNLSDDYEVLFLQGGATTQFAAIPMNIAKTKHIGLVDTGHWSIRAQEEAKRAGIKVDTIASSKTDQYHNIPNVKQPQQDLDYIHLTTNNTIEGTAYNKLPNLTTPLVLDVSSNFLAQSYQFKNVDVIYGGAQKNIGIAGLTIVAVRKDLITENDLPGMWNFQILSKKNSMLNTPPVFAIYTANLVLKWLKNLGGVAEIEKRNRQKSGLLYDFLDNSKLFNNPVKKDSRSLTNIVFSTGNDELDNKFIEQAKENNLVNLKGHRLVGGMRASLYNAMPYEGAEALVDFLEKFERDNWRTK